SWTPGYTQAGPYTVTFTATNALTGSASTALTVANVDRAPAVSAPAVATVNENQPLTVNVTAADPDGEAIASLTASGTPPGATFTPGPGNTSGTLSWTPPTGAAGSYLVTFTATNALTGSATTNVTVTEDAHAPVVVAPSAVQIKALQTLTFQVTASDADGQAIASLTASGVPAGAGFTPAAGNASGTFTWV